MNNSVSKRIKNHLTGLLLSPFLAGPASQVWAAGLVAPATALTPITAAAALSAPAKLSDAAAFAQLEKEEAAKSQPVAVTLGAYRDFLHSRSQIAIPLALHIYDQMAALQLAAKDTAGAHWSLGLAIARYEDDPQSRSLLLPLVIEQSKLYLADNLAGSAAATMRPFKASFEANHDSAALYASVLETLGGKPALIDFVAATMQRQPALLAAPADDLFNPFIQALISEQRPAIALQWAKLRFVVCEFDPTAIGNVSTQLSRAWLARDLAVDNAQAFTVALQDRHNFNPLWQVHLPESFSASPAAIASKTAAAKLPMHDEITLLLAAGQNDAALALARKLVIDPATAASGVGEVCRVLKARSLDLQDANAFVQYVKTGTGPNPLASLRGGSDSSAPTAPAVTPPVPQHKERPERFSPRAQILAPARILL